MDITEEKISRCGNTLIQLIFIRVVKRKVYVIKLTLYSIQALSKIIKQYQLSFIIDYIS